MDTKWLREALFCGHTSNAFKLGTVLTVGWFWVRIDGCSVLYRGEGMEAIDFSNLLVVYPLDTCQMSPPSYFQHNSGTTYFYIMRRNNRCGYEEYTTGCSAKVSIDADGELAEPKPNKIFEVKARYIDGNRLQLVWYYCPINQESEPVYFAIYSDNGSGQIDYENPIAEVNYIGRCFYSYESEPLDYGRFLFAVKAVDSSDIENTSLGHIAIEIRDDNPDDIDILSISPL